MSKIIEISFSFFDLFLLLNHYKLNQKWLSEHPAGDNPDQNFVTNSQGPTATLQSTAIINIWGYRDRELTLNADDCIVTPNTPIRGPYWVKAAENQEYSGTPSSTGDIGPRFDEY